MNGHCQALKLFDLEFFSMFSSVFVVLLKLVVLLYLYEY